MNGFQSPNYTQTPNDLFDELMPGMGLAELKVVMCIVRHTFGYHKDQVRLSIRAISRFTGLTAKSVMEGARQAEDHGLIERRMDGNKTTLWSAIVSVIPTTTRRDTKYHAHVIPSKTLSGVKESKEIEINTTTPTPEKSNTFTLYEQNIGPLTPIICDALKDFETTYSAPWVERAIKEAAESKVLNIKYIHGVLKGYKDRGSPDIGRDKTTYQKGNRENGYKKPTKQIEYTEADYAIAARIKAERAAASVQ